jgi:hypothetical protein
LPATTTNNSTSTNKHINKAHLGFFLQPFSLSFFLSFFSFLFCRFLFGLVIIFFILRFFFVPSGFSSFFLRFIFFSVILAVIYFVFNVSSFSLHAPKKNFCRRFRLRSFVTFLFSLVFPPYCTFRFFVSFFFVFLRFSSFTSFSMFLRFRFTHQKRISVDAFDFVPLSLFFFSSPPHCTFRFFVFFFFVFLRFSSITSFSMFLRFLFTHQKNKRSILRIFFGPFFFLYRTNFSFRLFDFLLRYVLFSFFFFSVFALRIMFFFGLQFVFRHNFMDHFSGVNLFHFFLILFA